MAQELRQGIRALDLTTRMTFAVLALASGVYTYLGVRELLDGSASITFFGAIIYSVAVSVGIYAFWAYLARFLPQVRDAASRVMLLVAMVIGSAMIIAMSSWLNAAALAGSAALEQHLAIATEQSQQQLEKAHENALAAQGLLPDIELAKQRFAQLADQERRSGALTGTSGSGTVVALLSQMSGLLDNLAGEVTASRTRLKALFEEGSQHLSRMRRLVSASGAIAPRGDAFAEEAVALAGVVAAMQQTSIAPSVKRAAEDLSRSFIAPVPDGRSADLASRQTEVVGRVEEAVARQSEALAAAADEILAQEPVVPLRFTPLSTPEAVIRYAGDFIPSWAGAISIDLMPGIIVFMLAIAHGAIRRNEGPSGAEHVMTAHEMMQAVRLYRQINQAEGLPEREASTPENMPDAPTEIPQTGKNPSADAPVPITGFPRKGGA